MRPQRRSRQPQPPAAAPRQPVASRRRQSRGADARHARSSCRARWPGSASTSGAQPVTIGKGPSTLQIADDPAVSTRHAELALRGGVFVVTDLGSTNGTFVNNQRITQPTRLGDGDLLRFGNTQMKFRAE